MERGSSRRVSFGIPHPPPTAEAAAKQLHSAVLFLWEGRKPSALYDLEESHVLLPQLRQAVVKPVPAGVASVEPVPHSLSPCTFG